jgi:hypothetical protein
MFCHGGETNEKKFLKTLPESDLLPKKTRAWAGSDETENFEPGPVKRKSSGRFAMREIGLIIS